MHFEPQICYLCSRKLLPLTYLFSASSALNARASCSGELGLGVRRVRHLVKSQSHKLWPRVTWLLWTWPLGPGTRMSGLHQVCEV